MDDQRAIKQSQRLRTIAQELGIDQLRYDLSLLPPPSQPPSYSIPDDERKADAVLGQLQIEASVSKAPSSGLKRAFTRTQKSSKFTYDELYAALSRVVQENGLPGVIEVLLKRFQALEGNVNVARRASTSVITRMRHGEVAEERGRLLQVAAEARREEVVRLLAPWADQAALDESLGISLQQRELGAVEVLLRHGANCSSYGNIFQMAANNADLELMLLMIRALKKVPERSISEALLPAVTIGSTDIIFLLVQAGADANFDDAAAFMYAVKSSRPDFVAIIARGDVPPSRPVVDKALDFLLSSPSPFKDNHLLFEVLLCASPIGSAINDGLFKATMLAHAKMMDLFLANGADINYGGASAVGSAIKRNRSDLVAILLQSHSLNPGIASDLVRQIPSAAPSKDRVATLSKLLVNGATGVSCSEMLITAVQQKDMDAVQLLLSYGRDQNRPVCSVDYNAGRSLQVAVAAGNIPILQLLALDGKPLKLSLQKAFDAIPSSISKDNYYIVLQTLLRAGAEGLYLSEALHVAVTKQHKSNRLVQLFVEKGVAVMDQTIFAAVSQGTADILQILLSGKVRLDIFPSAISLAMKLSTVPTGVIRFRTIKLLLGPATALGTEVPEISQAVIDLLEQTPQDQPLLSLLCGEGKADVNAKEGLAVCLATKILDSGPKPVMFDIVLRSQGGLPTAATVDQALQCAIDLQVGDPHRQYKIDALLRCSKPKQAVNVALLKEIKSALSLKQDFSIIQSLLAAGADVNCENGAPLRIAVNDPAMTDLLLSNRPSPETLASVIPLAMALRGQERFALCEKLIRAGAMGKEVDRALVRSVKEGGSSLPIIKLLLQRADVNHKDGEALRLAVEQAATPIVDLLLSPRALMPSVKTKFAALQLALNVKEPEERYLIVQKILAAGLPTTVISDALISALNGSDVRVLNLLLRSGASVEHKGGQAVRIAASSGQLQILEILVSGDLTPKPTLSTLTSGFGGASTLKETDRFAYSATIKILLEAGMRGEAIDLALTEAAREGDMSSGLTELLLHHGASAERGNGEAIEEAVTSSSLNTLQLLLNKPLSQDVLKRAFRAACKLTKEDKLAAIKIILKAGKVVDKHVTRTLTLATQENPSDRHLIQLLLDFGAFDDGEAMTHAAKEMDLRTLTLLANSPKASPLVSSVFKDVIKLDAIWISPIGLSIIELLLKKGAKGDSVDDALIRAIETSLMETSPLAIQFVDVLLKHGADVNNQSGIALQRTTEKSHFELILKLLPGADSQSISMAIPYLFTSGADRASVLKILHAFGNRSDDDGLGFDITFKHPDTSLQPVLFMALDKYPRDTQILQALLDIGFPPNQWIMYQGEPDLDLEPWPILCWALHQPEKKISNSNIELLIDSGANVNFKTKSGVSPLLHAIQQQRTDIVSKLIAKGVTVTVSDTEETTPLALASRLGNTAIMETLLQSDDTDCDDGSLHDAARELRSDSMRILIKYGHRVDYPSDRHDGRSALAELCLYAADHSNNPTKLEEAVRILVLNDADIRLRSLSQSHSGKSIFHHALDSSNPHLILTVLLKSMWEFINEDAFLFSDDKYTYSLTKYIEKDLFTGPKDQKQELLRLLRNKRATDRFWATSIDSPQPEDYCNGPAHIEAEMLHQRTRLKRQREMREDAMAALDLSRLTMVRESELIEIKTEAEIKRNKLLAAQELHLLTEKSDTQLQLELYAERQRQQLQGVKRNSEVQHVRALGEAQKANARATREEMVEGERARSMMQIEFVQEKARRENDGVRQRLAIEGSARAEEEKVAGKRHEREMARLKMQKVLVERNTAFAGSLQGTQMNQRQIGYVMGEVNTP